MLTPYGLTTAEMAEVFSPGSFVGGMLRFEAELARALADVGIAPPGEAEAVAMACEEPIPDALEIITATWSRGSPLLALIDVINGRLSVDEERRWVHHGATSQDAVDTSLMLMTAGGLETLAEQTATLAGSMKQLMDNNLERPLMGRTFLQHAAPTTFGLLVAFWLEPTLRHLVDLREARSGLCVQLGGTVGNLAGYGDRASEVVAALADRLDLIAPDLAWHTDRSRVWEPVDTVGRAVGTMAKVSRDIALLAQTDVGEIQVRSGGSSSVEGKHNPIDAIRALSAVEVCRGAMSTLRRAPSHELARSIGSWHAEWAALPLVFESASAVLDATGASIASLEVRSGQMERNLGTEAASPSGLDLRPLERVSRRYEVVVGND